LSDLFNRVEVLLTGGDITKRDSVIWGFTPDESSHFLDDQARSFLFREAILSFLSSDSDKQQADKYKEEYCKACRVAYKGEKDCSTCNVDQIKVDLKDAKRSDKRLNRSNPQRVR